jgi:hypothetical protein
MGAGKNMAGGVGRLKRTYEIVTWNHGKEKQNWEL